MNGAIRTKPETEIRTLLVHGLILGAILGVLACTIAAFSINPGEGQGNDLPLDSFRYRFGIWLDDFATPVIIFCTWPSLILLAFGVRQIGFIAGFCGALIAGIFWVLFWYALCSILPHLGRSASKW